MAKNWTMGFDQPALHLILNVVMTTCATSLALICYLLKRENERLTAELDIRNGDEPLHSIPKAQEKIDGKPSCAPVLKAVPPIHQDEQQDIREYVKRRSHDWVADEFVDAAKAPTLDFPNTVQNRNGSLTAALK
jgi:hypothetical protein